MYFISWGKKFWFSYTIRYIPLNSLSLGLFFFSPENIISERETPVFSSQAVPCHDTVIFFIFIFLTTCQRVFVHLGNTTDLVITRLVVTHKYVTLIGT